LSLSLELVFHLVNRKPTSLKLLVAAVEGAGYPLQRLTAEAFRERISGITNEGHPLYAFKSILSGQGFASAGSSGQDDDVEVGPDDSRSKGTLRALALPDRPHVDLTELHRLLAFARRTGWMNEPATKD